jgi:drug/metabolite transporter (DMT)-like permease
MPIVAAVTGWAFLGETVALTTGVGFLVVFAGFAVVQRRTLVVEFGGLRRRFARSRRDPDPPLPGYDFTDD